MYSLGTNYNISASGINECDSDPCQNNGKCCKEVEGYRCECEDGYTGVKCETGKMQNYVDIVLY